VVAQAAATSSVLTGGKFVLGVGSGEALNEHVTGARWPDIGTRLEMLEEAVAVMRELWRGEFVYHHGEHYTVENARIYTLPDTPPPVYVSGFGPRAIEVAGRIGDGYVTTSPDQDMIKMFRDAGGAGKPVHAGYKVCWGTDDDAAIDAAHETWANSGLPGELSQVLPSPRHFEQASQLVTRESTRDSIAYGDDVDRHVEAFRPFADADIDVVHISQMAGDRPQTRVEGFFEFYRDKVLPRLRELA
jgi:G6PDH family F420-dependent oxidoreductase